MLSEVDKLWITASQQDRNRIVFETLFEYLMTMVGLWTNHYRVVLDLVSAINYSCTIV